MTPKCVAAAAETETLAVPTSPLVERSMAVIERDPADRKPAAKTPLPAVRVASAGRMACESVLVKWTVPA